MDKMTGRILQRLMTASEEQQRKKVEAEKGRILDAIRKHKETKNEAFKMRVTEKFNADFERTSKKLGLSKSKIAEETLKEVFHFMGVKQHRPSDNGQS